MLGGARAGEALRCLVGDLDQAWVGLGGTEVLRGITGIRGGVE